MNKLNNLADQIAEALEAYVQPDKFEDVSLAIDNNDLDRPTLIVRVDRDDADILAGEAKALLQEQDTQTQHGRQSDTNVRVLATALVFS